MMNRRSVLKGLLGGAGGAALSAAPSLFFNKAIAQTANARTLVFIFQRGGADGLNEVVPYGDPGYQRLRSTLFVPPPNPIDPLAGALDLNGFFGLHPAMEPLMQLWNEGTLAVFPTVQYPQPSRSHFDSQAYIEHGQNVKEGDGLFNRHLAADTVSSATFRAISMGNNLMESLRGPITVPTIDRFSNFGLDADDFCEGSGCSENRLLELMLQSYGETPDPARENHGLVHAQGLQLIGDLELFQGFSDSYTPANGADYPGGSYGRHLSMVAQMIKGRTGLQIATINIGGWDTHSNQSGDRSQAANLDPNNGMGRRMRDFTQGIRALSDDLGDDMDNVVILTGTEFGRTSFENGSNGTDHGTASAWFAHGHSLNGGMFGTWPGLADDQLDRGRFLAWTINHRDIMGEILDEFLGQTDLASVFPGHVYQPVGLFGPSA